MKVRRNKSEVGGKKFVTMSISTPEEIYEWLRRFCFESRISMSCFVTNLLEKVKKGEVQFIKNGSQNRA